MSVWKSDEKLLIFASLISPSKIIMFEYKGGKTVNLFVFCFFCFCFLLLCYFPITTLTYCNWLKSKGKSDSFNLKTTKLLRSHIWQWAFGAVPSPVGRLNLVLCAYACTLKNSNSSFVTSFIFAS